MRQAQAVCLAAFSAAGAPTAEAQPGRLIYSGTSYDLRVTEPVPVGTGPEDLRSFIVRVVNKTGNAALDMDRFDGTGLTGISGQLHNEQFVGGFVVPIQTPTATVDSANASSVDSHFLFRPRFDLPVELEEDLVDQVTSSEPGDFGPIPSAVITGFAPKLSGVFQLEEQDITQNLNLAQVVVPNDTEVLFDFVAGNGVGRGERIMARYRVPEPGSLAILAATLVGLSGRRRSTRARS